MRTYKLAPQKERPINSDSGFAQEVENACRSDQQEQRDARDDQNNFFKKLRQVEAPSTVPGVRAKRVVDGHTL